MPPDPVVQLYAENVLRGMEHHDALHRKAQKVLGHGQRNLRDRGIANVKTAIRKGHPAEEVLKTARDEHADMIVAGTRAITTMHLFMGSVSREVSDHASVPVLVARNCFQCIPDINVQPCSLQGKSGMPHEAPFSA